MAIPCGASVAIEARESTALRARGEALESIRIREATAADIPSLAGLHVATCNNTYAPMFMKGPSYATRERQWREKFEAHDRAWFCFVVERSDSQLIGFAQGNRSENPEFAGELTRSTCFVSINGLAWARG